MSRQFMNDNQLEFDLGENEVATDISVEDPPEENSSSAQMESPQEQKSELDEVSDNVQKRISKLTARMREAERREQAAVEFARGLQTEKHSLQQSLVNTDYSRLSEAKNRLDTQQATLKAIIRKAREEGDVDTETEAVQRLTDLTMEQRQVAGWLQSQGQQIQQMQQQPVQQYVPQEAAPQKPLPSPKAEEWATRNPWFGQDRMLDRKSVV